MAERAERATAGGKKDCASREILSQARCADKVK
jgi:hypothetical protein